MIPDLRPPAMAGGGVEVPLMPTLAAVAGLAFLLFVVLKSFRAPKGTGATAQVVMAAAATPALPTTAYVPPPSLPAPQPQYKRAPFAIHFPQINTQFPDVWGVGEPLEVVIRTEEKEFLDKRQIPGLTLSVGGEAVVPAFANGTASVRHVFRTGGEKQVILDLRVPTEAQPRRTQRNVKIVDYRTEIAEVFATFKEEAGRTIAPLREDATPWEIFDILTGANSKIPSDTLRTIVSSYEEAKYSNHRVTRATYERLITSLLQLERVDL